MRNHTNHKSLIIAISALTVLLFACNGTSAVTNVPSREGRVISDAHVVGERIPIYRMGDLWMNTWADDDALYFGWGDGTGMTNCWPSQHENPAGFGELPPVIEASPGLYEINPVCSEYFCGFDLICRQTDCLSSEMPLCPITDVGLLKLTGPVPDFDECEVGDCVISRHIPDDIPAYRVVESRNDKPSSLLFVDGRLYAAIHDFAGEPTYGYIAYSDDYGATWTEMNDSPWGSDSNFRVLMFINMGQAYDLNTDGYVYVLGVPAEALWGTKMAVYLMRVPIKDVASYSTYEYFTGSDNANQPSWSSNQSEAVPVPGLYTEEQGSAIFHEGTGRYLFLTTKTGDYTDVFVGGLFEAPAPWGPWIQVAVLFGPENTPAWNDDGYIPGLISKGSGDDSVYFTISGGDNHYYLSIGRIKFELAP